MRPDYRWQTDYYHSDNSETMGEYLEIEMDQSWIVDKQEGSYAEITTYEGERYAVHASGDGDFFNHKIEFVTL